MTNQIAVYASSVTTVIENDVANTLLSGIDPSQVISEFNAEEVLELMDFSTIESFVARKLKEDE